MIVTGTILSFTFIEVVPTVTGLLIYAFLKEFKKCALLNCWDGGEFISGYALYEGLIWVISYFGRCRHHFSLFYYCFRRIKDCQNEKKTRTLVELDMVKVEMEVKAMPENICKICFTLVEKVKLKCAGSLCDECFSKMIDNPCPFCRVSPLSDHN